MPNRYVIQGADVLAPQGWIRDSAILIEDGKMSAINPVMAPAGVLQLDAIGLQLLPGIVDIHGDAFERMICPCPGVHLPLAIAEFPASVELAAQSQDYGAAVLMGAPNLVCWIASVRITTIHHCSTPHA